MLRFLAGLLVVFLGTVALAEETWKVNTLAVEGEPSVKGGKVTLSWEGEFINDTTQNVTLHAVLELLDDKGGALKELETSAVNVKRFGKQELKEKFQISADVWEKTKNMGQWGERSKKDPVNGPRIRLVELFGTSWCKYCAKARDFMADEHVEYVDYDVERDKDAADRLQELSGGKRYPTLAIDGKLAIVGWSEQKYKEMLFPATESKKEKSKLPREQPVH